MTTYLEKPLANQTVLVTRPRPMSSTPLINRLNSAGANVILHPAIEIREPADWGPLDMTLSRLHSFGTVVFLSQTGVVYFFGRFREKAGPEGLSRCQIAAISPATATQIRAYGEDVDCLAENPTSQSLADALIKSGAPEPILILRANHGSQILAEKLTAANLNFKEVNVYERHEVETVHPETYELLVNRKVDWAAITSPAIARATVALFGAALAKTKLASISPQVTRALEQEGFQPTVEAAQPNFEGLVKAMGQNSR